MNRSVVAIAICAALPVLAGAQEPAGKSDTVEVKGDRPGSHVRQANVVEVKGTIAAISPRTRQVTVKLDGGQLYTFVVNPDVKRFAELKVGDKLSARYHEAVIVELRKDGAAAPQAIPGGVARVPGQGPRPSGAVVTQRVATVEVQSIDKEKQSITALTPSGVVASFKVEDAQRLEGVKVGDKIDITYTEALIVSVE
jgi:hypothetical protein